MGIADSNNNGTNNGKLFESTYYSRLRIKNPESKLTLTPSFRSGLLVLDISEQKEGFKYDSLINICLSPTKAKLFAGEIDKFKEYYNSGNIIEGKAFGVNAGMGDKVSYIGIHADTQKIIYITIGKIDGSGNIIDQVTTSFNRDYHFALEWDNIENMDVAKSYNNDIELEQLYELLKDFGRHMNGAIGYSTIDLGRYDTARILKKMDPIFDKLGIERLNNGNGNGNNYSRGNNFLDNSRTVESNHTSIEDVLGE